jgi:eukaryotic-like serine/threonine-protein kinase
MTLAPGTRLGPYEVVAPLGAGGMGEVYRARDSRLGRAVAIKVLPDSLAGDPQRLRWFQQEARAVGALTHPNILSVHDVGEQDGVHFIVTELLEGTTLRRELERGPLSARRATEHAVQIARGLAAAHEKGVVHRDVKPENLFVTKDGHLKILDFGLARQAASLQPPDGLVTVATTQTVAGTVVGTVGYMAPEQITGGRVDHRADIFAFGVVFYEMLTGKRAFHRDSAIATSAAIVHEDPPEMVAAGGQPVSPGLQHIVQHCLQKDPANRFQAARDLALALDSVGAASSQAVPVVTGAAGRGNRWRAAALVLAALVVATAILAVLAFVRSPEQPAYRQLTLRQGDVSTGRFAPDGQTIVYCARWGEVNATVKLYEVSANSMQERNLDLPPARLLALSRTGELAIVEMPSRRLARVPLAGGAPRELSEGVDFADWSPDGRQLAVARHANGRCRLEYPPGKVLYETSGMIRNIRLSPAGDSIAFMDHPVPGDDRGSVAIVDLAGNRRTLTKDWPGEDGLAWSPDGREIWFTASESGDTERGVFAVTRGGSVRLILRAPGGLYLHDVAPNGRVLLEHKEKRFEVAGGRVGAPPRKLSWLQMMELSSGGISSDGQFAVLTETSGVWGEYPVYLAKFDGSPAVQLGNGRAGGISPDGKWVASILPADDTALQLLPTGIGETRTVRAPDFHYHEAQFARDGRLLVRGSESNRAPRMWVQGAGGEAPRAVTPEGIVGTLVTVDDVEYIAAGHESRTWSLYPVGGGAPRELVLEEHEAILTGAAGEGRVYVGQGSQVQKLDLRTGKREPFVTLVPTDPAGLTWFGDPIFSGDGRWYAYSQIRVLSTLYLATGLK